MDNPKRHAYASFAINAGFSLKAIGENLGHARASTTERYAHLLLDARRPVSEVVANGLQGHYSGHLNRNRERSLLQRFRGQSIAESRTVKAAPTSNGAPLLRAQRLDGRLGDANWRKELQSRVGQRAPNLPRLFK